MVITAIGQFPNSLKAFNITEAIASITVKLVGYTETVRVLHSRLAPGGSVVLFGGVAKDRPYPGSTMVTTFNGGISGLVKTLAVEIAPHRVNAIHPGVVGDSPKWRDVPDHPAIRRTPIARLVTVDEIVDATEFLLRNSGINAHELDVNGGTLATNATLTLANPITFDADSTLGGAAAMTLSGPLTLTGNSTLAVTAVPLPAGAAPKMSLAMMPSLVLPLTF